MFTARQVRGPWAVVYNGFARTRIHIRVHTHTYTRSRHAHAHTHKKKGQFLVRRARAREKACLLCTWWRKITPRIFVVEEKSSLSLYVTRVEDIAPPLGAHATGQYTKICKQVGHIHNYPRRCGTKIKKSTHGFLVLYHSHTLWMTVKHISRCGRRE